MCFSLSLHCPVLYSSIKNCCLVLKTMRYNFRKEFVISYAAGKRTLKLCLVCDFVKECNLSDPRNDTSDTLLQNHHQS